MEINLLALIFIWKYKTKNNQNNFDEGLKFLPSFKIYYEVIAVRTVDCWQTNTSRVKNREYRNRPSKYWFKTKLPKQYSEEGEIFLRNDAAAAAYLFGKN